MKNLYVILSLLFALTSLVAEAKVSVIVSVLPLKNLVSRVAGEDVEVRELIVSGHNPVSFELGVAHMKTLAQGQVYFKLGLPFEKHLIPRIKSINPSIKIIDLRTASMNEVGADPHIWTSPQNCVALAEKIASELIKISTTSKVNITSGLSAVVKTYTDLSASIKLKLAPKKNREFLVFHPAWGHFANEFSLIQIPIEKDEHEPGPKALVAITAKARKLGLKVIFVQKQFSDRHAQQIAKSIGARVIAVDPLGENLEKSIREFSQHLARELN